MNIRYLRYIRSSAWQSKRVLVLQRDSYRCQLWFEHPGEEVHHRTYAHLFDEPLDDLVTLCRACHHMITDAVRRERHQRRVMTVADHARQTPTTEIARQVTMPALLNIVRQLPLTAERIPSHGVSIPVLQDYRRCTPDRA
jgi:5-methylcytosine-specific restriction endonuclease McrA